MRTIGLSKRAIGAAASSNRDLASCMSSVTSVSAVDAFRRYLRDLLHHTSCQKVHAITRRLLLFGQHGNRSAQSSMPNKIRIR